MWDVFISHASEDKEEIARPLAQELRRRGLKVWYDEFSLDVGDSLRRSIDRGLAESRFGVVILSRSFFVKEWTQRELDGLTTREVSGGKVILPVWHGVAHSDVAQFSPVLADRVALMSDRGIEALADKIVRVIGVHESDLRGSSISASRRRTPEPVRSESDFQYHELPVEYRLALIEKTMDAGALEPGDLDKLVDSLSVLKMAAAKENDPELLERIRDAQEYVVREFRVVAADMEQANPSW